MKLTYTDLQDICKEISGYTDTSSVAKFRRDINSAGTTFISMLGREYNRKSRTTDLEAGKQYYQLPEDGHRLKEIIVSSGGWTPPMEQIPDEYAWRQMNMFGITGIPTHYFIRGYDEVGLYPTPSATVTDGIELVFAPRHLQMTQEDTTSTSSSTTITVTNGSQTITNSDTAFTAKMVGQWLEITDGTDSNWYRVQSFTDTSNLVLENFYQGASGSGKSFRIGEVAEIPEESLEALADFAMYRHFVRKGDLGKAKEFKSMYDIAFEMAKDEYGSVTDSQVITAEPQYKSYNPFRDPPASISA